MGDHHCNVSDCLYVVLDLAGASTDLRRVYEEVAMMSEILETIAVHHSGDGDVYNFGSYYEGTTTPGLNSDVDMLRCLDIPVVESISDAPRRGTSLVMVRDESTKPGYVKLQTVIDGVGQTIYHRETDRGEDTDHQGRICMGNSPSDINDVSMYIERNGPAVTISGRAGWADMDTVRAHKCSHVPTFTQSWMSRERPHNWPQPHQIDKMKHNGCFLVGVNHPSSQNAPIEWRVSFSLQERELMLNLNPTQHKCYVLLKIIKKDIIHKSVTESISSYHCKTCLFYAIENTRAVFWAHGNLLDCTRVCIKLLLRWVREQNCPNFFIPEENMFDRLKTETLRKVQTILEDILERWHMFLWSLTTDDIGSSLHAISRPGVHDVTHRAAINIRIALYGNLQRKLSNYSKRLFNKNKCTSPTELLNQLRMYKLYLIKTYHVTEHTEEENRLAISYFMPHLHLQISQCLASMMLDIRDERVVEIMFRSFMFFISKSRDCDLISTNLIVASFCLQSGRFETCEKYLLDCEFALEPYTMPVCDCSSFRIQYLDEYAKHVNKEPSAFSHIRTWFTNCITFPPSLSNLVPPALRYEMHRSVRTPSGSRNKNRDYWFDWIVVDPRVYLYFLQYILYTKTNKPVSKQVALDNLVHVIQRGENTMRHQETAYNLLGWIYKQEHKLQQAMDCFLTSWRLFPNHNAAKWHGIELIRSVREYCS